VRWGWVIVGAVLVVLGVLWILQGLNVLRGSVMSDETVWAWIGAAAIVAGLSVLVRGLRR
jgi:hypothetical protein